MAKLAAYAQYQASQQNQAKSKAGTSPNRGGASWSEMMQIVVHVSILHLYLAFCLCVTVTPAESFDWGQYICSNNTAGAPVSCFKHVSEPRLA